MTRVVRVGAADRLVEENGQPTNLFWRFLVQVGTIVTSFADLDGNANDIGEGDVNRFREIADLVVTRDGNGNIETIAQNGRTTTVVRDVEEKIETLTEIVDDEPSKITTKAVVRDGNKRVEAINVTILGFDK